MYLVLPGYQILYTMKHWLNSILQIFLMIIGRTIMEWNIRIPHETE